MNVMAVPEGVAQTRETTGSLARVDNSGRWQEGTGLQL